MKVLYFHQYFCTPEGNSGIRSYEMARYLVEQGHRVTMVFGESPRLKSPLLGNPYEKGQRRGSYEGIDLIELNVSYNNKMSLFSRTMAFIKFSLRSIRLVFQEDFDIVFASSTPITAGIPGIVMKWWGKHKPFVFEVRDLWPELPREMGIIKNRLLLWAMGRLEYASYNRADACVALSPGIKQGVEKRLSRTIPVHLIPNGCDLDLFKPGKHARSLIPGCGENDFISVFIGAHGIANGLDAALDAAAILNKEPEHKHIKVVLIGDGKIKKHLADRVRAEHLNNVIMLDPMPKKDLINYLHAADLGLMLLANVPAFYFGTSPNKFFDYIAAGLPVLNNYPGWLAEMISGNNMGKVVLPDQAGDFAGALVNLSSDAERLEEMGKNARAFAEKEFDRRKLARQFERALLETIENYTH
jgi:glycosyltransferase involved in cell wall biosynthesis